MMTHQSSMDHRSHVKCMGYHFHRRSWQNDTDKDYHNKGYAKYAAKTSMQGKKHRKLYSLTKHNENQTWLENASTMLYAICLMHSNITFVPTRPTMSWNWSLKTSQRCRNSSSNFSQKAYPTLQHWYWCKTRVRTHRNQRQLSAQT